MPYFTICIPAYNRANTILRTLDSIDNQEFSDYEVIVVDDGSSDLTAEVVSAFIKNCKFPDKIQYLKKTNGGKHTALNLGIEKAKGTFFMILDSDDWLAENALNILHSYCERIICDDNFSGVMGRCMDSQAGLMLGKTFDTTSFISSYFEFHFVMKDTADSCECNKTSILKKYRFPEDKNTKFVPEAWMFDQIGVHYKLLLCNDILEYKEYQENGISNDNEYKIKNKVGFLYHYISRIENVLPFAKGSRILLLKCKVIAWLRYWQCVKLDKDNKGPRVKKISTLGFLMRPCVPIFDLVMKVAKNEIYRKGR